MGDIKENILLLCKNVGFPKLSTLLYLITNKEEILFNNCEDKQKYALFNKIFYPLNYEIKNIDNVINNKIVSIKKMENNNKTLVFDKYYSMEILLFGVSLTINGFIKKDNITLRNSSKKKSKQTRKK